MKFSNLWYDRLKWVCLILLPAIATFLSVLLPICGVSAQATKSIVSIMTAIATMVGSLIGVSSINYYKGEDDDRD